MEVLLILTFFVGLYLLYKGYRGYDLGKFENKYRIHIRGLIFSFFCYKAYDYCAHTRFLNHHAQVIKASEREIFEYLPAIKYTYRGRSAIIERDDGYDFLIIREEINDSMKDMKIVNYRTPKSKVVYDGNTIDTLLRNDIYKIVSLIHNKLYCYRYDLEDSIVSFGIRNQEAYIDFEIRTDKNGKKILENPKVISHKKLLF